jgi:Transglutaminase-like superfamily
MQAWLAPDVRAARVETDIVFLDIGADAYLCLPGAAGNVRLSPDGALALTSAALAEALVRAGLVAQRPCGRVAPSLPPARFALEAAAARLTPASIGAALQVNRIAARAITNLPFREVLALAGPLDPAALQGPTPALLAASAAFARMAPWLPHAGLCLMRSLQQRLFLSRRGHAAAWVFGVRTWPFEAHCWLQAGEVVLDDTPAHAAGFAPILVV